MNNGLVLLVAWAELLLLSACFLWRVLRRPRDH